MSRRTIGVDERPPIQETIPFALQHLFAMFGATVLVPFLFKVNPATSLLMNGIGTLIYIFATRGMIPAYLGSSFAFISPVFAIMASSSDPATAYSEAQGGFILFGLSFIVFSVIVKYAGTNWLDIIFPPAAMGAVVAVIGLELAPVAADMAGFTGKTVENLGIDRNIAMIISTITLSATIFCSVFFKGFLSAIPVLFGVVVGFITSIFFGIVSWDSVGQASWLELPMIYAPTFSLNAMLIISPAIFVVLAEHIGHLVVTGNIVEKDLIKKPGLSRSLFGDGISNVLSGLVGATPNTTYGENIGVMAITRVFSVWVIGTTAVIAVCISFIGKFGALIRSIPVPVMGGICILLFGVIAAAGIRMLIEKKVDYSKTSNLILTSVILVTGVSGAAIKIGSIELKGMALGTVVSIALSLIFNFFNKMKVEQD